MIENTQFPNRFTESYINITFPSYDTQYNKIVIDGSGATSELSSYIGEGEVANDLQEAIEMTLAGYTNKVIDTPIQYIEYIIFSQHCNCVRTQKSYVKSLALNRFGRALEILSR